MDTYSLPPVPERYSFIDHQQEDFVIFFKALAQAYSHNSSATYSDSLSNWEKALFAIISYAEGQTSQVRFNVLSVSDDLSIDPNRYDKIALNKLIWKEEKMTDANHENPNDNVFEFPAETLEVVDKVAKHLGTSRADAISVALALMEVWVNAHEQNRILVERPASGPGKEYPVNIVP